MRIAIKLQPLSYPAAIPATHHQLQAFIYETVEAVNPALAQAVHDHGWAEPGSNKRFKFFVFSVPEAPRGFRFQDDDKVFDAGTVFWQIASPRTEFITSLIAGLAVQPSLRIGRTQFAVEEVRVIPPPTFTSEMRLIALSPLVASTAQRRADGRLVKSYLRDEQAFATAVGNNLLQKYQVLCGGLPAQTTPAQTTAEAAIEFAFDQEYLQRAGGFDSRKVTRMISFVTTRADGLPERIQIRGIQAPFIVRGNPALIQTGWEC
ncbi:MAG TPA: CRISPR-associated endoribonuclease Cas6, partial [Blastocatellia bacterium]|nr:CRISPR-associated endoribonuclease Cas6 [Blastocatellia bacterium]